MNLETILIIISIMISAVVILYLFIHHKNLRPGHNIIFIILLFLFFGFFHSILLYINMAMISDSDYILILWNLAIIISLSALGFLSFLNNIIIGNKRVSYLTAIIFSFFSGIIISFSLMPNSIEVRKEIGNYYFIFQNFYLYFFFSFLSSSLIILIWYSLIKGYAEIINKKLARLLIFNIISFSFITIAYNSFFLIQTINFKYLYLSSFIVMGIILFYEIIKKPDFFNEITNRLYDFILFHKSGILLYSFNFETGKETEESILKGSILIGINHILANFIEKFDQLNLIKMKNREIVLEYDKKLDYAILLTTNKKNRFIEKAVQRFMDRFSYVNEEILSKMGGLIDTSHFKNTGDLIHEFFKFYLE